MSRTVKSTEQLRINIAVKVQLIASFFYTLEEASILIEENDIL